MKQAILSFGKVDVLLVQLPEDVKDVVVHDCELHNCSKIVFTSQQQDPLRCGGDMVPIGHYVSLLGKLLELTEEQCKVIVDCYGIGRFHNYKTESQYDELLHTTARESFFSKLKADGYFTINPYAKTKMSFSGFNAAEKEQVKELFKKRKESGDARTFPPDQTYVFIITKNK